MDRRGFALVLPIRSVVELRAVDALPAHDDASISQDGLSSERGTLEGSSGAAPLTRSARRPR